mgnify:CR=1 FL=1
MALLRICLASLAAAAMLALAACGNREPQERAAFISLLQSRLAAGTLVPLRPEVSVAGAAYTALCAPGRERHPPVKAFLAWLCREFEAES